MKGISVIICCYNSEKIIEKCLRHIFEQKNMDDIPWEIIVVNNNSQDATSETALNSNKNYNKYNISFKVVDENIPGLSNARIKGCNTAIYDYLLYVDDDNFLFNDYVSKAFDVINSDEKIGIVGGLGIEVVDDNVLLPNWFEQHKITLAVGPQSNTPHFRSKVDIIYGAGFIIRKRYWLNLLDLGFEFLLSGRKGKSLSSGEDTELCYAINLAGYDVIYAPELKFYHQISANKITENYFKKLYFAIGKANVVFSVYQHYLSNDYNPSKQKKMPLWLDRYLYLRKLLKQDFKKYKNAEKFSAEWSKYIEIKGQMSYLLSLRSKYDKMYKKLFLLKENIMK